MPEFDPVAAVRAIRKEHPKLKILVVSAYDDQAYVVGLLAAGVDGYHLKDQPLADLQLAVRRILGGERWISGPLVNRLVNPHMTVTPVPTVTLTPRQRELLHFLTLGYDNRRMAQEMDLSVKTVENHLTALYRAIGVESRLEAHNYAMHHPEVLGAPGHEVAQARTENRAVQQLNVLLVDDNARYRTQLGKLIGKAWPAALLYEAEDAAEALRLAGKVQPQLAFIDVVLPEEDGIQCTRRLKAISAVTRVILISAYPDREFRRLGLMAGAVAFLDKKDLDGPCVRQVVEDALGCRAS
jgi:DNA-binding NarL/FixJ family response regulator